MLIVDTHIHIYSCYSLQDVLLAGAKRMMKHAEPGQQVTLGFCLAERFDCNFFKQWKSNPESFQCEGLTIEPTRDGHSLKLCNPDLPPVYLFAGRQINTKERIEVLSLGLDQTVDDTLPIRETIQAVKEHGGVPVLCWAPGKWFFERGETVRKLIDEWGENILLADTTMRPVGWPTPTLFKYGKSKSLALIAGSDPLPFAGEEQYAGRYVTCYTDDFDPEKPTESLRKLLCNSKKPHLKGTRASFPAVLKRLYKNAKS